MGQILFLRQVPHGQILAGTPDSAPTKIWGYSWALEHNELFMSRERRFCCRWVIRVFPMVTLEFHTYRMGKQMTAPIS